MRSSIIGVGTKRTSFLSALCWLFFFVVGACGGDSGTARSADAASSSFHVGGVVSGLVGRISLSIDGGETLSLDTDGDFVFTTNFSDGDAYEVNLAEESTSANCNVTNGIGRVEGADVRSVRVMCTAVSTALTSLTLSAAQPLQPSEFDSETLMYELETSLLTSSVAVTATTEDPTATMTVNDLVVPSGVPSSEMPLNLGSNLVSIKVVARDGSSRTYQVHVVRGAAVIGQTTYAKSSNTGPSDEFGVSLALSGHLLAVGAPHESSDSTGVNGDQENNSLGGSGAVYVFRRSGAVWVQDAYIKASNPGVDFGFGSSLALSGDTLVVGSPYESSNATGIDGDQSNTNAPESGAVYVFRRSEGVWSQEAYIKASNAQAHDRFGSSLALSDDRLAVGAPYESSDAVGVGGDQYNDRTVDSGAVYVFRRNGSVWTQEAYVKASNTGVADHFGQSVALEDRTLVVAATGEDSDSRGVNGDQSNNLAAASGAVYVFRSREVDWSQEAYLKASNADAFDFFGWKVALWGDTLAVSAPAEDGNARGSGGDPNNNAQNASGAVYIFGRHGSSWSEEEYVKASNTQADDRFGASLALVDDTLVVGAGDEDSDARGVNGDPTNNGASRSGAVYVLQRSGATWTHAAYVKASNPDPFDHFGRSVALSADTLAVGAGGEDSNATGLNGNQHNNQAATSGAVYIFR